MTETGYQTGYPKLTVEAVEEIRRRRRRHAGARLPKNHKDSLAALAEEFGVSLSVISKIGRTYTYGRKTGLCAARSRRERSGADL